MLHAGCRQQCQNGDIIVVIDNELTHIRAQPEIADTAVDVLVVRVVQVTVKDLFGQRERSVQPVIIEIDRSDLSENRRRSMESNRCYLLRTTERLSSMRW
jgi:hypothetical protein